MPVLWRLFINHFSPLVDTRVQSNSWAASTSISCSLFEHLDSAQSHWTCQMAIIRALWLKISSWSYCLQFSSHLVFSALSTSPNFCSNQIQPQQLSSCISTWRQVKTISWRLHLFHSPLAESYKIQSFLQPLPYWWYCFRPWSFRESL